MNRGNLVQALSIEYIPNREGDGGRPFWQLSFLSFHIISNSIDRLYMHKYVFAELFTLQLTVMTMLFDGAS